MFRACKNLLWTLEFSLGQLCTTECSPITAQDRRVQLGASTVGPGLGLPLGGIGSDVGWSCDSSLSLGDWTCNGGPGRTHCCVVYRIGLHDAHDDASTALA